MFVIKYGKETICEQNTCFKTECTTFTDEALRLYPHYKKGCYWVGGGVSDQPALYLDVMKLLDTIWELK